MARPKAMNSLLVAIPDIQVPVFVVDEVYGDIPISTIK